MEQPVYDNVFLACILAENNETLLRKFPNMYANNEVRWLSILDEDSDCVSWQSAVLKQSE